MKNILYIMHVHWGWIKQRPQFIVEGLGTKNGFNITVAFPNSYRGETLKDFKSSQTLNYCELYRLPFGRFRIIRWLNTILYRIQLKKHIAKADIIWITHPWLYDWIKSFPINQVKLIYDCMDDALEAPKIKSNLTIRKQLYSLEEELINRSHIIFSSSNDLISKIAKRYGKNSDDIHLINNAINLKDSSDFFIDDMDDSSGTIQKIKKIELKKIIYIGTVAEWIDFDLIIKTLNTYSNLAYIFIGPKEADPTYHERMLFLPPVKHKEIFNIMKMADALVMPFVVSDFIKAVNPVKLYEYIYSCKPVIAVSYPETDKFSEFVYLYNNESEFMILNHKLSKDELEVKKQPSECIEYTRENTWDARLKIIEKVINEKS